MKPKRTLSQNFLVDQEVITRVVAGIQSGNNVVEIGPGKGALTKAMLKKGAHVTAIELDRRLIGSFHHDKLTWIEADALDFDFAPLLPSKLVANLPFHIATPLILRLIQLPFSSLKLIVQKEVAQRLCAAISTKAYSALTLHVQLFAASEYLFTIPPSAFQPKPKVDSALIQLKPHPKLFDIDIDFIYDAFRQRRKMLRGSMGWGPILEKLRLDSQARAENLSLADFAKIWREVNEGNAPDSK